MDKTTHQAQNLISRRSVTKPYRLIVGLAALALAVGATTAFAGNGHGNSQGNGHNGQRSERHGGTVLKSDVFGSQVTGPVLFGVPPGGAPWVIDKGDVKVRRDGRVKARLDGLVIPTPPENGTNPVAQIAASVYCNGARVGTTQAVSFSLAGDARIDDALATPLPSPCLAPAVLFNPAAGSVVTTANYIAATGV
jgi:hypothetical protein